MFNKFILSLMLFIIGALACLIALFYYRDKLPAEMMELVSPRLQPPVIVNAPNVASDDFSPIVNSISPAVVNISTMKIEQPGVGDHKDPLYDFFNDFFSPPGRADSGMPHSESDLGSGLIVSPDGYILTSSHLVFGAHKVKVTLYDGRVFSGRIVGADPKTDLAVIKIDASDLSTIPWGDSDEIMPGQFVLAVGNPFGLSHTVTLGIISAVGRANVGIAEFEDFIQTDAAINPGNSGGPLVSQSGQIVGINTAIFTKSGGYQGIGFAVPGNMAQLIMKQLMEQGRVVRGWLGVMLQEMTPELAAKFGRDITSGALVSDTLRMSPAREAGIMSGDIILQFHGQPVANHSELKRMVALSTPGTEVTLKVFRDRGTRTISMTVGSMPEPAAMQHTPARSEESDVFSGVSVIALSPGISSQLNLEAEVEGVVVARVESGSTASEEGIKRGDVIVEINHQPVRTVSEFRRVSNSLTSGDTVLILINRGGGRFFLTISLS